MMSDPSPSGTASRPLPKCIAGTPLQCIAKVVWPEVERMWDAKKNQKKPMKTKDQNPSIFCLALSWQGLEKTKTSPSVLEVKSSCRVHPYSSMTEKPSASQTSYLIIPAM